MMGLLRSIVIATFAIQATCMVIDHDLAPTIEARAGWTFLGCYTDNVSGRALPNGVQVAGGTSAMTNELCESTCLSAGYSLAGTEYAGECWCGNAVINGGSPAPDGSAGCNMACKGNAAETCGGGNRLDIYSYGSGSTPSPTITATTSAPTATSSGGNPLSGWSFLGCYSDNVNGRALPIAVAVSGSFTNEGCQTACLAAGYSIAGTEYAAECWCGNSIGNGGGPALDGSVQCNMACKGNAAEICGGPNRLDVYQHGSGGGGTTPPSSGKGKRGINYTPQNKYGDATLANYLAPYYPLVSWAYNYGDTGTNGLNANIEFMPQLWTINEDYNTWAAAMAWPGTKGAFSFNEPDLTYSQSSNLLPAVAAAGYQKYMQPFAGKVRLGMPCVLWNNQFSYSSGGNYNSPTWLEYFVGNCTGCHFDFMCIHYYQDCNYPNGLNYFFQNVTQAYNAYKLPVNINEFECTIGGANPSGNDPTQIAWMKSVLPWLDAQSYVERYAWFGDYPDYLVNDAQTALSPLGITYATYTG